MTTSVHAPAVPLALSVNRSVAPLVQALREHADALGLHVSLDASGVCLIDAGIQAPGGAAAGLRIADICMAGLGHARIATHLSTPGAAGWPTWLEVHSSQPVLACLGSQYAGWSLAASKEETGGKKFFALGSGPARALAGKEELFKELAYRDAIGRPVCWCWRWTARHRRVVIDKVLHDCGLAPEGLTLILTPTSSLAGTTQVVARVFWKWPCTRRTNWALPCTMWSMARPARRCRRPARRACRPWAAPTTPYSTGAVCT